MIENTVSELRYRFSRSSGPGGQGVNKVSTQVELLFDIKGSEYLTDEQKNTIFDKLRTRINSEGIFILKCDETRSQHKNKEIVIERFKILIADALEPVKKRIKTRPGKAQKERRLSDKRAVSEKKKYRKPVKED